MTSPDLTVTDGATSPADGATSPDPGAGLAPGAVPTDGNADPVPADVPTDDPPPSSEHLANVGALGGDDLAAHLGAESLEAHAAAQVAQGVADGTQAPAGMVEHDTHNEARAAWLADPQYATAFTVPGANDAAGTTFERCTLCAAVVGPDHDWHTEQHRRGG